MLETARYLKDSHSSIQSMPRTGNEWTQESDCMGRQGWWHVGENQAAPIWNFELDLVTMWVQSSPFPQTFNTLEMWTAVQKCAMSLKHR